MHLDSNDIGFICAVCGYKRNAWQFELPVTNLTRFEHERKPVLRLTVFRDLWRNQLWQWLEEGCRNPVLRVWFRKRPSKYVMADVHWRREIKKKVFSCNQVTISTPQMHTSEILLAMHNKGTTTGLGVTCKTMLCNILTIYLNIMWLFSCGNVQLFLEDSKPGKVVEFILLQMV